MRVSGTSMRSSALAFVALLSACGGGEGDPTAVATTPPAASASDAAAPASATPAAFGQIDRARLLAADARPEEWLTAGRDFGKSHYSPLDQINRETVSRLGFAWEYVTNTNRGLEATPIVVDGVIYTSGTTGRVYALEAATGKEIWSFDPKVDGQINRKACCDQVNRGVAVWQGKVYVAALDGRLFALDAATGAVRWVADTIIDKVRAYSSTGAPEVAGKVVVIGNGGAEYDARGYVSAYDLETGELAWRFFTVPGDPSKPFEHPELEVAAKTWDPNSRWEVGLGGTVWDGMVYDPELNLLYLGTGNAALWACHDRSPAGGDNLFLASILAINPDTGRLVWHYQEVPGECWDYTATQPMILTELGIGGTQRKVLMQAPKNGFFYILDRETGELLSAQKYVPVNWATHVDLETGRPAIDKAAADYRDMPKFVYPSSMGGHAWHPMSYSPQTGLVYIPVIEAGMIIMDVAPGHQYVPGAWNTGVTSIFGGTVPIGDARYPEPIKTLIESGKLLEQHPKDVVEMKTRLRAWDPVQGRTVWETAPAEWWDRAGVLSTAGGLVFQGTGTGYFRAYDAETGAMLKEIEVGSTIMAAPMSYAVDGVQYVAVMAAWGGGGWSISHPTSAAYKYGNNGRILVFKLDGGPMPERQLLAADAPIPKPPELNASAETIARGGELFGANCANCHMNQMDSGAAKDLRRMTPDTHAAFEAIVLQGAYRSLGMPQWDDVLSQDDAKAIHAYLISLAWEGYRRENASARAEGSP
jgi:quinohemoprotein ethanol dehydrogenase